VPNGKLDDVSFPVVVALFPSVVVVARDETVKVKVVATAAVTFTPFTMAILVSAELAWVPPIRMIYDPVLVGFVIELLRIFRVMVPDATVLPPQTVKVSTLYEVVAIVTVFPPPGQVEVAIVMPVEVTFARTVEVTLPKALVLGSNVYEIVWPAVVDEGLVYTMVWFAGRPGRESLKVSLTLVKLEA